MNLAHPLAVTLCQVFVDGDHMDTLAFQGVQIDSHDGSQGLAFTGLHLGDIAAMQDIGTFQLTEERKLADDSFSRFTGDRKSFRLNIIKGLSVCQSFLEFHGLVLQLFIA